jgi:hypothetical protein
MTDNLGTRLAHAIAARLRGELPVTEVWFPPPR